MKFSPGFKIVLALFAGLFVVLVIDPLDPSTVSTPFLLGILLMAYSLRQTPSLVMIVSALYLALTIIALISFQSYFAAHIGASPHPSFWLFQRSGLFVILCGLANYLAHYRTETEKTVSRLETIIAKLPVPVVLSDASGNIIYANHAIAPLLHEAPESLAGKSYFNFFQTQKSKGASIRSYFEFLEHDSNKSCELEVHSTDQDYKLNANLICLGTGSGRLLVTVLEAQEKVLSSSGSA